MAKLNTKIKIDKVLLLLFIILFVSVIAQFTLFKENKLYIGENSKNSPTSQISKQQTPDNEKITVMVDFDNGRKIKQEVVADTVFKALEIAAGKEGYKITSKQFKYGLIVDSINRVKNENGRNWIYMVNNVPGKISSDRYTLSPGDIVEWKYSSAK